MSKQQNNSFSVDDICAILKASAECGVQNLKIGQLEVSFMGKPQPPTPAAHIHVTPEQQIREEVVALDFLDQNQRSDDIDVLQVADPLAYEELIAQAEQAPNAKVEHRRAE